MLKLFDLVGLANMFHYWISVSSGTLSLTSLLRQAISWWLIPIVRAGTTFSPESLSYIMDRTVAHDRLLLRPQCVNSLGRPLSSLLFFLLQARRMLEMEQGNKCIQNKAGWPCGQETSLSRRSTRFESPTGPCINILKKGFSSYLAVFYCFLVLIRLSLD